MNNATFNVTIAIAALLIMFPVAWRRSLTYDLRKAFKKLGNINGKTKDEIVKKAGKPKVITHLDGGHKQLMWAAGKYQIVLLFDAENMFIKIESEVNP